MVYVRYSGLSVGSQNICQCPGTYKYDLLGTRVFTHIIILRSSRRDLLDYHDGWVLNLMMSVLIRNTQIRDTQT